MKKHILKLDNISKIYGKTAVLKEVSLHIEEGEIHCLVGENGAGKSTLIKILSGAISPETGEITLFEKKYLRLTPEHSLRLGISTIYQDDDLIPTLSVADNIFLGRELLTDIGSINISEQNTQALKFMRQFGVHIEPSIPVEDLSIGQRQLLQIMRALHRRAKLLIMDEPTTSLGEEDTRRLLALVKELPSKGISVIYISHYFDEIYQIGDRATVIKDGEKIGTYLLSEIPLDQLVNKMVGREATEYFQREYAKPGKEQLSLRNLSRGEIVRNVSFDVHSGEIFGLGGLVGSGRTELARILAGADRASGGTVFWGGKPLTLSSPKRAMESGICMISEDRKELGMFMIRSIEENIVITANEDSFFLNLAKDKSRTLSMAEALSIKAPGMSHPISDLSGGNQQKCVIARNLLLSAKVIIFDEPTKGVDIGAKREIYKLIVSLAQEGKVVMIISSYMPELISLSDRIGIMREGSLVDIVSARNADEDTLMKKYLGLFSKKEEAVYE